MRKEDFVEVLGDINENYVKEAETIKKAKKPVWIKWGAMAACLCLVAAGTLSHVLTDTPNPGGNLPNFIQNDILQPDPDVEYTESRVLILFADLENHKQDLEAYFNKHNLEIVYTYSVLGGYAVRVPDELDIDAIQQKLSSLDYVYSVEKDSVSAQAEGVNTIQ